MKKLIALYLVFATVSCDGANYYLSAAGSDINNGTSTATPFKTIAKLNTQARAADDSILFRCGDIFYGKLILTNEGKPGHTINYGSYGTGAKPIITGLTEIVAWTNLGSNIWESTSAVSTLSYSNMVVINGISTAMGRTPNTGSYYHYQSHSGTTTITSRDLTGSKDWTGAELCGNPTTFQVWRNPITAQRGNTLTYTYNASKDAAIQFDNQAFIIQNDPGTLDVQNEWYYNPSTKKLRIYSRSRPTGVQIATIDTLIDDTTYGTDYWTFTGINFIGANTSIIEVYESQHGTCKHCNFSFAGKYAFHGNYTSRAGYMVIDSCSVDHCNSSGILLEEDWHDCTVTNDTIKNCGTDYGMIANGNNVAVAIVGNGSNAVIQNNIIDSCGYNGIVFLQTYLTNIGYNFISNTNLLLKDGAAIYSQNVAATNTNTGYAKVHDNTIINIMNDAGIYCDDKVEMIEIYGNNIANVGRGIYLHNTKSINVHNNTVYVGNGADFYGKSAAFWFDNLDHSVITGSIFVKNNVFVAKTVAPQYAAKFLLYGGVFPPGLTLDSNNYSRPIDDNITIDATFGSKSLSGWQKASGQDAHSIKSARSITDVNDLRFEYNETGSSKIVALPYHYINAVGATFNGTITLLPFTSAVLIKNGAMVSGGSNKNN